MNRRDPTNQRKIRHYLSLKWIAMSPLIFVVLGLVGWAYYVYVRVILYDLVTSEGSMRIVGILLGLIWHLVIGLLLVSYFRAIFTDPGSVPIEVPILMISFTAN
eukprot:TRINITY_DN261_c0_g2_i3.p1 TRINITY_DN261_c0_g2~~TRINITY_DN261_c0_g2_i3.p1  ORF type:complete len:104 (-),score=13.37 TRINITY_DN261_c0_g2_i3:141-452(-)